MTAQEWIDWYNKGFDVDLDGVCKVMDECATHLTKVLAERDALRAEVAELREASAWIVECEKWDDGSQLANEKARAQAMTEYNRSLRQVSPELPPTFEAWMMLVARKQGRDESAAELAALRAEVEHMKAAPVVVPELTLDDVRGFIREWLSQPLEERGPELPGCPQAELALRKGYTLAASRLRTIGPGEVVVSEKELNVLLILERYARKHGPESIDYAIEALDTIRSQKGGAA